MGRFNPFEDVPYRAPRKPIGRNKNVYTHGLTVSDRRCLFNQLRSIVNLNTETVLWNGVTAGEFTFNQMKIHIEKTKSLKKKLTTFVL